MLHQSLQSSQTLGQFFERLYFMDVFFQVFYYCYGSVSGFIGMVFGNFLDVCFKFIP